MRALVKYSHPFYVSVKRQAHRCDSLRPKTPISSQSEQTSQKGSTASSTWRQEMKGADANMGWTFRCAENSIIVTVRWTPISRNLTYAIEKAGLTTASCLVVLKTAQTGPSTSPMCDPCNRTDHRFLFPDSSSPLQDSALWLTCQLVPRPHHHGPWTDTPYLTASE